MSRPAQEINRVDDGIANNKLTAEVRPTPLYPPYQSIPPLHTLPTHTTPTFPILYPSSGPTCAFPLCNAATPTPLNSTNVFYGVWYMMSILNKLGLKQSFRLKVLHSLLPETRL